MDLLSSLSETCARLLDVATAGLLLADVGGTLHVVAASSENTRHLESYQVAMSTLRGPTVTEVSGPGRPLERMAVNSSCAQAVPRPSPMTLRAIRA